MIAIWQKPKRNLIEILQVFKKYYIYMIATQTLETIPEETVVPATPERVTSDVPKTKPATAKNQKLAECNRLAREAKKQAEAQKPPTNTTTEANANASATNNTTEQSSNNSTNTVYLILTVGGLIVSAFGVYYQREAIKRTLGRSQKTPEYNTVAEDNPPPPKPKENCGIIKMK